MKTRLIISILSLMLFSCETVVEIELPERDSDITVNALFNTQQNVRATISASKGILEAGQIAPINNATVTIEGSDGTNVSINNTTIDLETKSEYYELPMTAKPNVDYTISVSAQGFETVTARSSVVAPAPIIAVDTATTISDGLQTSQISLTLNDGEMSKTFTSLSFMRWSLYPTR